MKTDFSVVIKNPSKKNVLKFLLDLKKEYNSVDERNKEFFLEDFRESMLFIIFKIEEFYKSELGERTNSFFVVTKDYWLIICWYLSCIRKDNADELLDDTIRKIKEEWIEKEGYELEEKIINEITDIAEERFSLLSILENSKSSFYFFKLPFQNKYSESCYNRIRFNKTNIHLFELFQSSKKDYPLHYSFGYSLGQGLFWYLVKNKSKLLKKFQKEFKIIDQDLMTVFSEAFSLSLLRYTEYDTSGMNPIIVENFIRYFEEITKELHVIKKLPSNSLCPCGSGKKYKDCCKSRDLVWAKRNGKLVKQLPLRKGAKGSFESIFENFKTTFGRKPYSYEKMWGIFSTTDMNYEKFFSKFDDEINFNLAFKYASLKTGMFLSQYNKNQFTNLDLQEWDEAIAEFREKNSLKLDNGKSVFETVKNVNIMLKYIDGYVEDIITTLNMYIGKISKRYDYRNFTVTTQKDFSIVSARKLVIDSGILENGIKNKSIEEVTNITRIIYEDLLQTEIILGEKEFFNQKIKPLSLLEKGTLEYKKTTDGKYTKNILVNPKTKEEFNIKINIKDISLKSKKYGLYYDNLFDGLSSFIHLNIMKIPRYFSSPNIMEEAEEYKVTSLLGLFLLNQCLYEIKSNIKMDALLYRDFEYVYDKTAKYILSCLEMLFYIDKDNEIYISMKNVTEEGLKSIKVENTIRFE